jgi:hypothetical protein
LFHVEQFWLGWVGWDWSEGEVAVAGEWEGDSGAGGVGGEDGEEASGPEEGFGGGEGLRHVVYGAESNDVKEAVGGEGFGAGCPDFGGKGEGADDFAEEGGLFVLGFGEGDAPGGVKELDGEAGEAGSGAKVEEGGFGGLRGKLEAGEEGFAEVALDDGFRVTDGGEVGAGVPLEEEVEVEGEMGVEGFWDGSGVEVGGQEGGDAGVGEGGHASEKHTSGLKPSFLVSL